MKLIFKKINPTEGKKGKEKKQNEVMKQRVNGKYQSIYNY